MQTGGSKSEKKEVLRKNGVVRVLTGDLNTTEAYRIHFHQLHQGNLSAYRISN